MADLNFLKWQFLENPLALSRLGEDELDLRGDGDFDLEVVDSDMVWKLSRSDEEVDSDIV